MLLFSTILPINDSMTKDSFIELAIKWNQGSPHKENVIDNIEWHGERNVKYGDDKLWMQIEEYRNKNIIAIRYEKTEDDGVVWDTDYVMNFDEMKMSVRLDRSYLEEAQSFDSKFSTPAFIALLIDGGYVKDDNELQISRIPIAVTRDNLSLIADVINGKKRYQLPVVFISKTFAGNDPVDAGNVAKRLKGLAHVLVQEDTESISALKEMCGGKNEYNGAIGIYFPNRAMGHEKILNHVYEGSENKIAEKVIQRVILYSNLQKPDMLYTWQGVNNSLLRDKYSSKREELAESEAARRLSDYLVKMKSQEAEMRVQDADQKIEEMKKEVEQAHALAEESKELVDSVDEEMEQMRQQIKELIRQNEALSYENQGLHTRLEGMSATPILYLGSEDEFFQGEIKEFILEALDNERQRVKPKTRRADVLGDLIRSNGGVTGLPKKKGNKLKKFFTGFKEMPAPMKSYLKEIGFKITDEGKHYKLVYFGDGRYWTTVVKTGGDSAHGGLNAVTAIIRDML